ncbi:S8 family serine peptidase, partial [Streptomyces sp. SID7499]|nr:S8 family serine peptidase [Streptomyces sp. SID7499]
GVDVTGAPGDETDDYRGHGTTMAELIAGTGEGGGLKGLAPGAEIIPVRMSDASFMSKRRTVIGDMKKAIRAAADSDAQIINVSMADDFSQREAHEAVKYAESKGKLVIAGVGNGGDKENRKQYPASYPEVVGVASADRTGKVSYYSQHSGSVDVASPG